jgi:signal transduction histidine kinase
VYAPVSLLVAGLVFGALTLVTVQESPQFSLAASVPGGIVLLLTATWLCTLAAAGTLWWDNRPRRAGVLLGLAGLSWLVPEWDSPNAPAVLYAAALLLASMTPTLLLHAALTWRDSRLSDLPARLTVAGGYVIFLGVAGLARAMVLDPVAIGCFDCPDNPWLVREGGVWLPRLEQIGGVTAALWLAIAAAVLARTVMAGAGPSRHAAILLPALAFLLVLAARELTELGWGLPNRSPLAGAFWAGATLALAGTALGASWLLLARRRARRSLGHILVELARGQQPGRLRDAFAARLADPTAKLLYPKADGTMVDALGRPFAGAATSERRCTPLEFGGSRLGVLLHSSTTSISSEELDELVAATHLGLEHEGLTARARSEERDLRASGVRLLTARDSERRRLERDLHDGAQQRLVGMALGLQLLSRTCPDAQVETARKQLALAIEEVRAIAQGLSPPVLVDAGLVPAIRALAEKRDLRVMAPDLGRFDRAAEITAYQIVENATHGAPAGVTLSRQDHALRMSLTVERSVPDLTTAADRVVTLGGRIAVDRGDGTTALDVELPVHTWEAAPQRSTSLTADQAESDGSRS